MRSECQLTIVFGHRFVFRSVVNEWAPRKLFTLFVFCTIIGFTDSKLKRTFRTLQENSWQNGKWTEESGDRGV